MEIKQLYQVDEHEWLMEQVRILRTGMLQLLDKENLIDYLAEMSNKERRELENRFIILLVHMLKFTIQPEKKSKNWSRSIREQQRQIRILYKHAPNLQSCKHELYIAAYPEAVKEAASQTRISSSKFPIDCPWTHDQALTFE